MRGASYAVCSVALEIVSGVAAGFIHYLNFLKMFELFFALFMAFACPAHNNNYHNNGTVTAQDNPPADGDNGHVPPKPPKPMQ